MIATALLGIALATASPAAPSGDRAFWDNFNGDTPRAVWTVRGTDYVPGMTQARGDMRAASVSNGRLHLRVTADPENPGHYLNGHIGTEGAFEFTYGCAAARIRFQPMQGAHGAFWLLAPSLAGVEVQGPETDVAEYMGDSRQLWHNVYWPDPTTALTTVAGVKQATRGVHWHSEFHVYEVCWRPAMYRFKVDGALVSKVATGLSDRAHFLVLSLLTKDWEVPELRTHSLATYHMDVDWIGVWRSAAAERPSLRGTPVGPHRRGARRLATQRIAG